MKRKDIFRRIISLATANFFLLSLLGVKASGFAAGPFLSFSLPEERIAKGGEVKIAHSLQLDLPPELGTIEKSVSGQGPLIVHIQTAHGNYEAQKKIQAILHHLKDKYGIKLLLLEGTAFKLHPELLKLFPDRPDLTMKALDMLAKKSLVKAPELFLAEAPDVEAYGIEDIEAYVRNGRDFRAVLSRQVETERFLGKIHLQLERLMSTYLSKELRLFLKHQEGFESKRIPLPAWIAYLQKQAKMNLDLDLGDPAWQIDWPMFYRIIKLQEIEQRLDRVVYSEERENFLRTIDKMIPQEIYDQIQSLLMAPLSHHQLPDPETSLLFEKLVSSLPLDFDYSAYPNVKLFIAHLILQSELKGGPLFDEIETLIDKLSRKLAQSEREQRILNIYRDSRLLEKLMALELTPRDYEEVESRISGLYPSRIVSRLIEDNISKRVGDIEFSGPNKIDALLNKALDFYRGTQARDGWMLRNIKERLETTGQNKAVVVTGGFHAGPFQNYFEAHGANYVLITPKISVIEGREPYVKSILDYQITETDISTYESIPFLTTSPSEMQRLGYDPALVRRDIANSLKTIQSHRETVPRKEPVEVPETVPAEPEPAPIPETEPAPELLPLEPDPVPGEPGKELVPAGELVLMRSEVRSAYDQIREIGLSG